MLSGTPELTSPREALPKSSAQSTEGGRQAEEPVQGAWHHAQARRGAEQKRGTKGADGRTDYKVSHAEIPKPDKHKGSPEASQKRCEIRAKASGRHCEGTIARYRSHTRRKTTSQDTAGGSPKPRWEAKSEGREQGGQGERECACTCSKRIAGRTRRDGYMCLTLCMQEQIDWVDFQILEIEEKRTQT